MRELNEDHSAELIDRAPNCDHKLIKCSLDINLGYTLLIGHLFEESTKNHGN